MERKLDEFDIRVPEGYAIAPVHVGLNVPTAMAITETGEIFITDAGFTDGDGKVLTLRDGAWHVVASGFAPPLVGLTYDSGRFYIAERGRVIVMKPSGTRQAILTGLPSDGDHHNNPITIGPDQRLYFGQGTATNSGIVGPDNDWVQKNPYIHDDAGKTIRLRGINFETKDILTPVAQTPTYTGAFLPYGVTSTPLQWVPGVVRASGSILAVNRDGSGLEQIAWGLRNPFGLAFDATGRLFAVDNGMDERGSRPVANCPDVLFEIRPDVWYGWPDFVAGEPITHPLFASRGVQPQPLLDTPPMIPPHPLAAFAPHSATAGMVISRSHAFGFFNHAFIAEFGRSASTSSHKSIPPAGHRISRVNTTTGETSAFAMNRAPGPASVANRGGFERVVSVSFGSGPETDTMFVIDMGMQDPVTERFIPNSGVIWRISRGR